VKYKDEALAQYDRTLAYRHTNSEKEYELAAGLYRRNIIPHLPKQLTARILDLGCGYGYLLRTLRKNGYSDITGIDICPANVSSCREQGFNAIHADNREFLEKHKQEFDSVILTNLLEHYDKESGLDLLHAVHDALRSGGRTIIVVPNMANPVTATRTIYIDLTHEISYTEESLSFMLELAGFSEVHLYQFDHFCLRSRLLNSAGRIAALFMHKLFGLLFLLNGMRARMIQSKLLMAVAER
jgi:2-polyprenyl-3-methyl-5-hydroxy-6-metoxy-1,4-benzoquinol methylase